MSDLEIILAKPRGFCAGVTRAIETVELALKESAFDCELFYNRNSYPTDEIELKCKN